jgi:hypothetical protein
MSRDSTSDLTKGSAALVSARLRRPLRFVREIAECPQRETLAGWLASPGSRDPSEARMNPPETRTNSNFSPPLLVGGAAALLSASLALACGSQDKQTGKACNANPPAYIDVTLCAALVDDKTTARGAECATCCQKGGHSHYSFACGGHCTCASPPLVSDTATCATEVASSNACSTCCLNAGYHMSAWNSTACTCQGQRDDGQICAATLDAPDPTKACPDCCLDHGYLNVTYFGLTRQCTCSG